jgi:hypothetical protein
MSQALEVMGVIGSNQHDWLVTLCLRDGTVSTRRVAPGSITKDQAIAVALLSEGVSRDSIADANVRRVSESTVQTESVEESLASLLERMRTS